MSMASKKCPECPYDKPRNLGTHLFFVHGYSKTQISEWRMNSKAATLSEHRDLYDIFRCQFCPKTYKRQNSCRAHERVVHCVSSSMRQKCVPCPIPNCHFTTTALLDLCAHANETHKELGDFTIREARFENMGLFQQWRLQYEENTQSVLATESVNSNAAAGTTLRYLRCAQLEAQIRKVRNMQRRSGGGGAADGRDSDYEQEEVEVDGEVGLEEEEERGRRRSEAPAVTIVSVPRRSDRKRKRTGDFEEGYGMEEAYGRRRSMKKGREEQEEQKREPEKQHGEEEEEEVDVEQLDDIDEIASTQLQQQQPSTSKATSSGRPHALPKEERHDEFVEEKDEEDADSRAPPRLTRASSAHLEEEVVDQEDDEEEDSERGISASVARLTEEANLEKRMNSRHCTAHMRVLVLRSGAVHVEYCESHLGHPVIQMPPVARAPRSERAANTSKPSSVKQMVAIPQEVEQDIEAAKARRKGRRETEHRKMTERRMRTERDEFAQLCNRFNEVGANVELYEDPNVYDEEEEEEEDASELQGGDDDEFEVIEEEEDVVVDHD